MEVTLYLPYYDYNDGAFDVSNDYYKSEEDYANMVEQEYNKDKDIVFNSMLDAKNGSGSLVQGTDGQTYKFGQKTAQNEDKVAFSKCEGVLWDIGGSKDTVETEISLWVREHNSINQYVDKLGEDWVLAKEPKRNFKVHFKNNANQDVYAVLEDCKIMEIIEDNSFVLYIERITLIDNI